MCDYCSVHFYAWKQVNIAFECGVCDTSQIRVCSYLMLHQGHKGCSRKVSFQILFICFYVLDPWNLWLLRLKVIPNLTLGNTQKDYSTDHILHVGSHSLYLTCCILHIAFYTLHHRHCILHVAFYMLHLRCCILHVASYTLHFTCCILGIASYTLHLTCCILHVAS